MSELEVDFKQVAKEINAKIKEATKAMKEANAIAKKAGIKSLTYNEYDDLSEEEQEADEEFWAEIDIYPLFGELDKAGWQTSSIGC
jgi:hypothetical protein